MSLVGFRPYKNLDDEELINQVHENMRKLHSMTDDSGAYEENMIELNNMIKEAKERKIRVDNDTFINNIIH